jgi:mannose-6-phosphate isomerase class I
METNDGIYKLKGKVLHYDWGGYEFLPHLLNISNTDHKPFAEYWMGAHPLAPSELHTAKVMYHFIRSLKKNLKQYFLKRYMTVLENCLISLKCRM